MATRRDRSDGEAEQETYTAVADEPLSEAVIAALQAAAAGTGEQGESVEPQAVGALTPLYETIDPDALDALFGSTYGGTERTGSIAFTHDGYEVTATAAGEVVVSTPAPADG